MQRSVPLLPCLNAGFNFSFIRELQGAVCQVITAEGKLSCTQFTKTSTKAASLLPACGVLVPACVSGAHSAVWLPVGSSVGDRNTSTDVQLCHMKNYLFGPWRTAELQEHSPKDMWLDVFSVKETWNFPRKGESLLWEFVVTSPFHVVIVWTGKKSLFQNTSINWGL